MSARLPRDIEPDEEPLFARWHAASTCPRPDLLMPAIEMTLVPEALAASVRAHLDRCSLCRELAEAFAAPGIGDPSAEEAARIDAQVFGATSARASTRWWAYAAGLLLLGISAALLALTGRTVAPPELPVAAAAAPPARAAGPVLALRKPEIELPPEFLTLRSASPGEYAAALDRALDPFVREDYAEAVRRLERVARAHDGRPHPVYYLGVAHLMLGAPSEAVRPLELARQRSGPGSSLYAEATWYLAVSLERSGRRASAAVALSELCGTGGPRGDQACDGLRVLLTR